MIDLKNLIGFQNEGWNCTGLTLLLIISFKN